MRNLCYLPTTICYLIIFLTSILSHIYHVFAIYGIGLSAIPRQELFLAEKICGRGGGNDVDGPVSVESVKSANSPIADRTAVINERGNLSGGTNDETSITVGEGGSAVEEYVLPAPVGRS